MGILDASQTAFRKATNLLIQILLYVLFPEKPYMLRPETCSSSGSGPTNSDTMHARMANVSRTNQRSLLEYVTQLTCLEVHCSNTTHFFLVTK
jgi:hypothetical protein